jgi:hypothetical protein
MKGSAVRVRSSALALRGGLRPTPCPPRRHSGALGGTSRVPALPARGGSRPPRRCVRRPDRSSHAGMWRAPSGRAAHPGRDLDDRPALVEPERRGAVPEVVRAGRPNAGRFRPPACRSRCAPGPTVLIPPAAARRREDQLARRFFVRHATRSSHSGAGSRTERICPVFVALDVALPAPERRRLHRRDAPGCLQEPLDKIRVGADLPESIAIRILVPTPPSHPRSRAAPTTLRSASARMRWLSVTRRQSSTPCTNSASAAAPSSSASPVRTALQALLARPRRARQYVDQIQMWFE